jgi:LysM repeat protein
MFQGAESSNTSDVSNVRPGPRVRCAELRWADTIAEIVSGAAKVEEPVLFDVVRRERWGEAGPVRPGTDSPNPSAHFTGRCQQKDSALSTSTIIKRIVGVIAAVALAFGISAATAGPADAASKTVWDKVAKCESGGRWHIHTGNGFYGGLQFSSSTWKAHGGKKYASKAHKASKAEQIAIARRVLATQGRRAWPHCGKKAHLTKKNGKASKRAKPSTNPGVKKKAKKKSSPASTPPKSSTAPATGSSTSAKAGSSAKSAVAKKRSKSTAKYIKVKRGDTLAKIAKRHHVKGGWKALWKLNKSKLKNPNHLKVGVKLKIKK